MGANDFDDLAEFGQLAPGARILEIGCGTGQATRSLAERGYRIIAVELGADMAAIGRWALAIPDFVERLQADAPFNDADQATFYGGGSAGYTDY